MVIITNSRKILIAALENGMATSRLVTVAYCAVRCWIEKVNSLGGAAGSKLESEIIGMATTLLMPATLRFTGLFWDLQGRYHILEHLSEGIGSDTGHYNFPKK